METIYYPQGLTIDGGNGTMTINCICGQSYTAGQWPSGHYTVICSCGRTLISRDGTGVHVAEQKDEKPAPKAADKPAAAPPQRGHGRAA